MFKTFIAGLCAVSLSLTSLPAYAQSHDERPQHEDIATAIFGLVVLGALASALTKDRDDNRATVRERYEPPVVRVDPRRVAPDRGGLRQDRDRWFDTDRDRRHVGNRNNRRLLPMRCMRNHETRFGHQRMFGRKCLERNYRAFDRLPRRCAVRVYTNDGVRNGFDPLCLREQGFRADRHR